MLLCLKKEKNMSELRFGTIGAGMGASHGIRVMKNPDTRLVALCDKNEERIQEVFQRRFIEENGFSEKDLPQPYTDMEEMFEKEDLDAVIVSLPSGLHHKGGVLAAKHGVNVLMDKPLDINIEKCDEIIKACHENKVMLGVIFQYHYIPLFAGIKKAIEDKLIGDLISVDINLKTYRTQEYYDSGGWRGTWEMDGGGSLMNQGVHLVDYMLWLCGEPEEVTGDYGVLGHAIETEDWAAGIVRFKDGVRGTITTTTNVQPKMEMNRIEVHGTKGSIMAETIKLEGIPPTVVRVSPVDDLEDLGKREFDHSVGDYIDALKNNRAPEVTGRQARMSVAVVTSVYKSAQEGKRIKIS